MGKNLFDLGGEWGGWNGYRNLSNSSGINGGVSGLDCGNEEGGCGGEVGGRGGGDGVGERLVLSSFGSGLSSNLFNLFLRVIPSPGGLGASLTRLLATSFLPTSRCFSKEPKIGFSASNFEISSKRSSSGFYILLMFLGSSFCLNLALLILPFVT